MQATTGRKHRVPGAVVRWRPPLVLEKIVFLGLRVLGERSRFVSQHLRCFLIFRSRPDHTTVLMVMDAQTAVGSETWDLTRMAAAAGGRSVRHMETVPFGFNG